MKRLWSPWRSSYIETFKKPQKRRSGAKLSLFTVARRSREDAKNLVVWRGKHCFVIMNRFPYNSGHVMIVPNRQTADIYALTPEELLEIMETIQRTMKALDTLMKPQGYNVGANIGRAGGAGVDEHIHFHVVPRWNGDTNFMPVLSDTKVVSEEIKKTWKTLRKQLCDEKPRR
jgi:ATP adenylyltransferase